MIEKEVIIIGGGPAGLLAGEEAQRLGLDYLIIEQGQIGQAWREVRPNMPMLSPCHPQRDWTSLSPRFPIWKLPVNRPYCSADEFVNYLQAYAEHFDLDLALNTRVARLVKTDDLFELETNQAPMKAKTVLLCTGMFGNPYIPEIPGLPDHPLVSHSHYYRQPEPFRGKRVIVIGGGNSGAEVAIELAGLAQVHLLTREPLKFFSKTQNLCDIRGISESYLLELIRMQLVRHLESVKINRVKDNLLELDREILPFDHIICATGYRPVLDLLADLPLAMDQETKFPVISAMGESGNITNLFFAGPLAYRGMGSLFIHGFIKDVPRILRHMKIRVHQDVVSGR